MENIVSVERYDDTTSHWVVKGPLDREIEWVAETTLLEPNQRIAWKAAGDTVKTSGQATFTALPNDATQITLTVHYVPTGGIAGKLTARVFGNVEERIVADLGNFKKFCEGMHDRLSFARERSSD